MPALVISPTRVRIADLHGEGLRGHQSDAAHRLKASTTGAMDQACAASATSRVRGSGRMSASAMTCRYRRARCDARGDQGSDRPTIRNGFRPGSHRSVSDAAKLQNLRPLTRSWVSSTPCGAFARWRRRILPSWSSCFPPRSSSAHWQTRESVRRKPTPNVRSPRVKGDSSAQ